MISTVLQLMTRVLGDTFARDTFATWRAVLKATFALDLTDDERAIVATLTQRSVLPSSPVRELWLLLGRRSGKSIIAALLAVHATTCRTYTLAPGECGVFMVIAADRKQARVIKRYVSGLLKAHESLAVLIASETADAITLTNGLVIEIHTCSFRSLRGYTVIGAACDEIAFWDDEDSANPDHEVLVALRAAMASVPEAMLIALTSVYARRGEVWRMYEKHFGKDSPDVLIVNGSTTTMNPTIDPRVIDSAYEDDPVSAPAEYGGEFRSDVAVFLPLEALDAVVQRGRFEQAYQVAHHNSYFAFLDPAGGTGQDSMTMAIAHHHDGRAVLDLVREVKPPFGPEATVGEFADVLKAYSLTVATSDRYAGSWPTAAFQKVGITVLPSTRTKSEIYQDVLPLVMSGTCELLDDARLLKQFGGLERRTARGGKDSIDHAPRQHDDVANAAAGALVLAAHKPVYRGLTWDSDGEWLVPEPPAPEPNTPAWIAARAADAQLRETDRDAWMKIHNLQGWRAIHYSDKEEIARRTKEATAEMMLMIGQPSRFQ